MCVKFHDEENRLEIMGGASCLYEEIQKCSIQNEDANFKGKTIIVYYQYMFPRKKCYLIVISI